MNKSTVWAIIGVVIAVVIVGGVMLVRSRGLEYGAIVPPPNPLPTSGGSNTLIVVGGTPSFRKALSQAIGGNVICEEYPGSIDYHSGGTGNNQEHFLLDCSTGVPRYQYWQDGYPQSKHFRDPESVLSFLSQYTNVING